MVIMVFIRRQLQLASLRYCGEAKICQTPTIANVNKK